uniref:Vesicle associated membrane protein 1a n=1 Tax=Amphiprion percula TaxID=161767 RepID=A0A3P8T2J6_AMPPE
SNRRLQQTQAQVDEVVDIMRVNVDNVLERDQKLSELDDRADALQAGASQFESSKNCKVLGLMQFFIMLGNLIVAFYVFLYIFKFFNPPVVLRVKIHPF